MEHIKVLDKHFRIDLGILIKGKQEEKNPNQLNKKTQTQISFASFLPDCLLLLHILGNGTVSQHTPLYNQLSVPPLAGALVPREDEGE